MTTASFAREAGFSAADAAARLARLRKLAWLLDAQFRMPGTGFRFGVLLGLVSLYIVWEARALGAPPALLGRMLANIVVEVVGGAIPILGDLFDMAFKANLRNLALLEEYLKGR